MAQDAVLVCVTGQKMCARLIQRGAAVAREHTLPLLVLSVAGTGPNMLGNAAVAEALDYLYKLSAESDAEMTVLCSERPLDTITTFAKTHGAKHLVIGEGRPDAHGESFTGRLAMALPKVTFHTEPWM